MANPQYCISNGCYVKYSATQADYNSQRGNIGYGPQVLGSADFYVEWNLNGAQSISKPVWFEATPNLSWLQFEGQRLRVNSSYPKGTAVDGTYAPYGPVNPAAGERVYWSPNGYKAYNNTYNNQSVAHNFTFGVEGFPGRWYTYVKSPIFRDGDNNGTYFFGSVSDVPSDPANAGYSAT